MTQSKKFVIKTSNYIGVYRPIGNRRVFVSETLYSSELYADFFMTVRLCPTRTAEMNFSVGEARGIYMKQKI